MLVVGEASGDMHGARLVKALSEKDQTLRFFGVAGEQLKQTKLEPLFDVSQIARMGLVELAGSLRSLWQAYGTLGQALRERRPGHRAIRARGLDGVWRNVEVTAVPIVGQGQRQLGAMVIFWEADQP